MECRVNGSKKFLTITPHPNFFFSFVAPTFYIAFKFFPYEAEWIPSLFPYTLICVWKKNQRKETRKSKGVKPSGIHFHYY